MFKRLLSLGAAALAGLSAACDDAPTTMAGTWRSPAAWSTMVYATAAGPMLVEIHGRPFATPDGDWREAVAGAMSGQIIGRVTNFTVHRDAARHPAIRVVLAFNPPDSLDARHLCGGAPVPSAAAPGEAVTVQAAFCQGETLLASVRGRVAQIQGAADPRFRRLMGQVTRELFGEPR